MSGSVLAAARMTANTGATRSRRLSNIGGKQLQKLGRFSLLQYRLWSGLLQQGSGLIITAYCYIDHRGQNGALAPEGGKDSLGRNACFLSDGVNRGSGIAVLYKQLAGSLDDVLPCLSRLRLPPGRVVLAFGLFGFGHVPLDIRSILLYN